MKLRADTQGTDDKIFFFFRLKKNIFWQKDVLVGASENTKFNARGETAREGGGADHPEARRSLPASWEPDAFDYRLLFSTALIHYECLNLP